MLRIKHVHTAGNWQLWHSLPTKDTGTIQLIRNHAHSHPIWEIIVHATFKYHTRLRLIQFFKLLVQLFPKSD